MNQNTGRPYGGNRRVNDGLNRMERQNIIEGVKLNVGFCVMFYSLLSFTTHSLLSTWMNQIGRTKVIEQERQLNYGIVDWITN